MSRLFQWVGFAVLVLRVATSDSIAAVPAAERLLPNTTKAFLAVGSVQELQDAFNRTQLGQLAQDATMQPFVESLKQQIQENWTKTHQKLGITWSDLQPVPSGEVGLGLIHLSEREVAMAIVADVTGHAELAHALLNKINRNLTAQKAVRSQRSLYGASVTVLDVPKHEDQPAHQVAYVIKDDLLVAADSAKVIEGILARQSAAKSDNLASLPAFAAIVRRCEAAAGELVPHARWFIDPFGYVQAVRILNADQPKRKQTDMLKILKDQGFTAVRGAGGFVNFSVADYEMLHRSYVFAPGHESGEQRFTLAARMLDLPNGGSFTPPDWVPREVVSCIEINLDIPNAFESSRTLVDEYIGDEGAFEEILSGIRDDKDGPRVDIRSEIIAHLGHRITIISDLQVPITPKSERLLVGIDTTNVARLSAAIEKWMRADPDVRRREINGHVVWERIEEHTDIPMITIENSPGFGSSTPAADSQPAQPEEKPMAPNAAFTVAFGQLFLATHIDILAKALADETDRGKLADCSDYNRVAAGIAALRQPLECIQLFTRTDEAYQGVYELLRTGRMPEAESLLGKLLNALMGEGKEGALRSQRIDGSKLPEYDLVRRYFGPAGMTMTTEEEGWFLTGFTLNKEEQ